MSLIGRDVDSSNSPVPMLDMSKMRYNSALALSKMDIHINNALREPFRQLMKTKGHTLSKQTQVSVQTSCHSRSQQVCMVMLNWSVLYCQFAADMWLHLVGVALVYVADVVCRNHDIMLTCEIPVKSQTVQRFFAGPPGTPEVPHMRCDKRQGRLLPSCRYALGPDPRLQSQ